ncbi:hypothetical protein [Microbispora sp. H11081]|uniref:hypothetical protein n=1 Tax=Microbispora sp. H11081 TaxID=2729107 RepID=UPI001474697C|nr:hypothetical protein [Microbispora sp. H11081]
METGPLTYGATAEIGERGEIAGPDTRPARRRFSGPFSRPGPVFRLLPAAFVCVVTLAVLLRYQVSVHDIAAFFTYVALGLTFPGVLLARFLCRGNRSPAEELALGLALGYAAEVPVYLAARAAGVPLLVLAFPAATYLLFLAVPRLRGHWKSPARPRSPLWWSWATALVIAGLVVWSAAATFRTNALAWPALGASNVDTAFHLSLIGELRHHVPPTDPAVMGEPLLYHWFVHAELAATSWVTGVEPVVLLLRLAMLPMLAALVVLLGMVALRVVGSHRGALLAVLAALFIAAPSLYLGKNGTFTWGGVQDEAWASPSQTFGALLFAPVVLLIIEILEGGERRRGRWPALALFLVVATGAKATYLPLLAAGLAAVAAVTAARSLRVPRAPLVMLAMTAACLVVAQAVLYKGVRQGVDLAPLSLVTHLWRGFTGGAGAPDTATVIGLTLVYLSCWAIAWCGTLGLLARPRLLARPAVVLMAGMGAAGLGAVLLLGNSHLNQLYFLRAVYPYTAVVSVYGLLVAVRRSRASRLSVVCAAACGAVAAQVIPAVCGVRIPLPQGRPAALLYLPYLVMLALVTLTAITLVARRGRRGFALTLTMVAAVGLPAAAHARLAGVLTPRVLTPPSPATEAGPRTAATAVPEGALAAARWLRGHSSPDDLVATNGHRRWGGPQPCDGRQVWVSALTERRVLVEGWSYTAGNWARLRPGQGPECTVFGDPARLRANDAAFATPSRESILRLGRDYGVRWLFADVRHAGPIGRHAAERFRSGDFAVYEIPDGPR